MASVTIYLRTYKDNKSSNVYQGKALTEVWMEV